MSTESSPEARSILLRMARHCPHENWLLLEFPDGGFGAFWKAGFEIEHCTYTAEGDYGACAYINTNRAEVLDFMARSDAEEE